MVDIALAVWPFPLADEARATLRGLGYRLVPGFDAAAAPPGEGEQRFRHARRRVQLFVVEPGSTRWQDFLTLRDYLAQHPGAAQRPTANNARRFARLLPRANAWWVAQHGFAPLQAVAAELAGFDRPWRIAGGWALDLFLGQVSRVHHDVDVEIARDDQLALRAHLAARGWQFVTPYQGRLEPWPPDLRLAGERHQVHAHREGAFMDFLLTDIPAGVWYYRRQPEVVRLMAQAAQRTPAGHAASGLPYLAPELALLFKSRNTSGRARNQDQADFDRASPRLSPEPRAWLRWALAATDPHHPWIKRLGRDDRG